MANSYRLYVWIWTKRFFSSFGVLAWIALGVSVVCLVISVFALAQVFDALPRSLLGLDNPFVDKSLIADVPLGDVATYCMGVTVTIFVGLVLRYIYDGAERDFMKRNDISEKDIPPSRGATGNHDNSSYVDGRISDHGGC